VRIQPIPYRKIIHYFKKYKERDLVNKVSFPFNVKLPSSLKLIIYDGFGITK
jgi:hypothetical protein